MSIIKCPVCFNEEQGNDEINPACDICNGDGKVNSDDIEQCPSCEGSPHGIMGDIGDKNGDCSICSGNGYIISKEFYDNKEATARRDLRSLIVQKKTHERQWDEELDRKIKE